MERMGWLMTEETYERWTAWFRRKPGRVRVLKRGNDLLTGICYICYPVLLLWLLWIRDGRFWRALLVPGISFVLVSLFRKWRDCPRPYEQLDIEPLIHKDTRGKSFPSRHVFSITIIAATWWYFCPAMGIVFSVSAVLLAAARVLGGVHFPRDVMAGILIGAAAGWLGYGIL